MSFLIVLDARVVCASDAVALALQFQELAAARYGRAIPMGFIADAPA